MATIVVDELVTKLSYDTASVKDVKAAEKAVDQLDKANQQTAKSTDILSKEQLELSEQLNKAAERSAKLRAQQRKLTETIKRNGKATESQQRWLKKLDKELRAVNRQERELRMTSKELTTQQKRLGMASRQNSQEQRKLSKAMRSATTRMRQQERAANKLATAKSRAAKESRAELKALGSESLSAAQGAASTIGGLFTAATAGTAALGKSVLETGTNFESLRAQLKTVEGSALGADSAFSLIQEFTTTTPFQLEEVTTAFTRLKSLGLDASQESLRAFGNTAAAQGKSIIDFVDTVAAASTGEFERLKAFGIIAKSQGDQVAFTFKGVTTTVGKNSEEIQGFLKGLGETEFAGAMADQMDTASGKMSNLKDTIAVGLDTIAQKGPLEEFKLLLGDLSAAAGDEGLATVIAEGLTEAIHMAREAFGDLTAEDIQGFFEAMIDGAQGVVEGVEALIAVFKWLTSITGDTGTALQTLTLLAVGLSTAMMGPAGIVVAAGLVGVALGQMAAGAVISLTSLGDEITATEQRIERLQTSIAESNAAIAKSNAEWLNSASNIAKNQERSDQAKKRVRDKQAKQLEQEAGGLGAGLVQSLDAEEAGFQAQFIQQGDAASAAAAQEKLFTEEGRVVLSAVKGAEQKKIAQTEQRARKEARKRGGSAADVEAAGQRARAAAEEAAVKNRRKAFQTAQKTFTETGSAEAAALAGAREVEKRGKKGKPKKGKSEDLLTADVEKQIEELAKDAGKREAARALAGGASAAEANRREREQRKAVKTRLGTRFRETGELPAGISQDLAQVAALPNVEQTGGRLAPPVITINNQRIEVTGNTFEAIVSVGGTSATPQEVANVIATQARPVLFQDLALAIQNNITTMRR